MNRYIYGKQGMWMIRPNGNPIMNEEEEIWIKERDYVEEKRLTKSKLNFIAICLNSNASAEIQVERIQNIIDREEKHLDKNGREIKDGDITRIKFEYSLCVFEIKGSNIYSLESGLYVESLKKVDSIDMEVIGRTI